MHLLYNNYLDWHFEDGNPITKVILSNQIRGQIYGHSLYILYNVWSKTVQYDTRLGNFSLNLNYLP